MILCLLKAQVQYPHLQSFEQVAFLHSLPNNYVRMTKNKLTTVLLT